MLYYWITILIPKSPFLSEFISFLKIKSHEWRSEWVFLSVYLFVSFFRIENGQPLCYSISYPSIQKKCIKSLWLHHRFILVVNPSQILDDTISQGNEYDLLSSNHQYDPSLLPTSLSLHQNTYPAASSVIGMNSLPFVSMEKSMDTMNTTNNVIIPTANRNHTQQQTSGIRLTCIYYKSRNRDNLK